MKTTIPSREALAASIDKLLFRDVVHEAAMQQMNDHVSALYTRIFELEKAGMEALITLGDGMIASNTTLRNGLTSDKSPVVAMSGGFTVLLDSVGSARETLLK